MPFAGLTLGGGAQTSFLMMEEPAEEWGPVGETYFNKKGFMAIDPFVGCEFILTGALHLTLKADFSLQNTQALIRRIETNYTQATSGTRTLTINFNAQYILSRKLTLGAYFDHQVNTPLVSNAAYPTSNSSYGISLNLNLSR